MQNEKCKSCFECSETVFVKIRDDRNAGWRDSSLRRCANDQCWHIVDGTRQDRLAWISNVYDYKYFGDYELSPEQLAAVYEAKSLAADAAALSNEQTQAGVTVKLLEWRVFCGNSGNSEAKTPFGEYVIQIERDGWMLYLLNEQDPRAAYSTIDFAKAAAQTDYEQRIRSALSPRTVSTSEEQVVGSAIISKGCAE